MTDHFQDLSFSFWNLISLLWWAHHFQDYISYYFLFFLYSYYILELDLFAVVGPIFFVEERFIHQTSGHQVNLQWFLILTLCPMMLNVGGIAIMINTVNLIISSSSYPRLNHLIPISLSRLLYGRLRETLSSAFHTELDRVRPPLPYNYKHRKLYKYEYIHNLNIYKQ